MIAIDTNVLLRYLLEDDDIQAKKAAKLVSSGELVFLSHVVLVETVWTLKGKKYRLSANEIDQTLSALFEESTVVIQDDDLVWRALIDFRETAVEKGLNVDFPDALVRQVGIDAAAQYNESFNGFYTFDRAAQRAFEDAKSP